MAVDVTNTIPLCEPYLGGNERRYVLDALDSNRPCSGPYIERFERAVADYLGVRHAVAVSSGTAALHLALLAAGVGPGDEVLVSDLTFIAPVNAVTYCGATPVLGDAEPDYWQMDTRRALPYFRGSSPPKAILPVHVLGHPYHMDPLVMWAECYGVPIIEDATEALGAEYRGQKVGTLGNMACLSFNANKLITTGGGGMVVTNNKSYADMVRYLANQATVDACEHSHGELGYNYRMSNVAAAIGLAQMETIEERLAAKRRIAETYNAAFADVPGIMPQGEAPWARSAWWMYSVLIDYDQGGMGSRYGHWRLARDFSIETRFLFKPAHMQPMYRQDGFPVAERLYSQGLSLPCGVGLTAEQQARVIEAIREIGGRN